MFVAIVALLTLILAALIAFLSRRQKAGARDVKLVGEIGRTETKLDPEGTVIVGGELWRARSSDGGNISARTRIRVVGFHNQMALVTVCD